jgi:hypothetical protein
MPNNNENQNLNVINTKEENKISINIKIAKFNLIYLIIYILDRSTPEIIDDSIDKNDIFDTHTSEVRKYYQSFLF